MKVNVSLQKGTFSATGTMTELAHLSEALELWEAQVSSEPAPVQPAPKVAAYHVGRHTQVYVTHDPAHGCYWVCSCPDFRYRRQSPAGLTAAMNDACKHVHAARSFHARLAMARLSPSTERSLTYV